ncbi:AraC family transcriptional regulator [Kutzneria viridogrisea]|uniref:AraC-like DNA-binding protein n=1 Tax=Kutzneria viridogrisea TaxID=47990 RepID=A0ABR6BPF9_9PSEU|nr:AraC-like DNA-binding protein [Kutzneria viridogrisea]
MAASSASHDRVVFETTDYDQAGEFLTGLYGIGIQLTGRKIGYFYRHTRMAADAFSVNIAAQPDKMALTVSPLTASLLVTQCRTTLDFRCEGAEHRFGPGEVFLNNRTEDGSAYWAQWCDGAVQCTILPFATLGQVAATADTRRDTPIRFTSLRPHSPAPSRHVTATLDYLTAGLRDQPETMCQPLVAGTAGRLLAASILAAFPNTALAEPTIEDRHDAHPATLRRAIAFIDDHVQHDIAAADIAAAAHTTIRAVEYAFRRHRGTTPMGYLRQVRLHHAHQELLVTDPTTGVTVTEVAARWGFFHPGRFAHYYRAAYGRPPYRTLRRH